jgi:hypothetical protein
MMVSFRLPLRGAHGGDGCLPRESAVAAIGL